MSFSQNSSGQVERDREFTVLLVELRKNSEIAKKALYFSFGALLFFLISVVVFLNKMHCT